MPHRPERAGNTAATTPNGVQASIAAHIMRPTAQSSVGVYSTTGAVGSLLKASSSSTQKPWMTASGHIINRPMSQSKSHDSADARSTATTDQTVASLATEGTAEEEKREATISALLMVSGQSVHLQSKDTTRTTTTVPTSVADENPELNTMPLKKRKKHLDFLRKNQGTEEQDSEKPKDACHVSPISHSSVGSALQDGRTVSKDEVTPERPTTRPTMVDTSNRATSFDSKESPVGASNKAATQALLDSSKILNATDIGAAHPPSHVVVPHFPSVLHQVLSSQEFGDSVIAWLPDGESWKVLRWDALRRQVLPKYFADLRDEHGRGSGTIDAFLWHLTAWGFEEIKDGTDVGAYRHDLFIRGAQKLCSKMRFTAVPHDDDAKHLPNTVSPARMSVVGDRTLLQVPSLNAISRPGMVEIDLQSPTKRPRYVEPSSMDGRPSPGALNWSMSSSYRPGDHYAAEHAAWGHHYYGESPHMRGQYAASSYDPRIHRHVPLPPPPPPAHESVARQSPLQYSPPQVRSGRGGNRITNRRNSPGNTPVVAGAPRHSFPVSNRGGKGRKAICRPSSSSSQNVASATTTDRASPVADKASLEAEAHRIGSSVQGVAVAISRKTRKLPMAAKQDKESAAEEESSTAVEAKNTTISEAA